MINESVTKAGYSRRDFLKVVSTATAAMGLPLAMSEKVMAATMSDNRPAVIWLHFQECTGCSESLVRIAHPDVGTLLLDVINLEYQETLMPGAGDQAEKALHDALIKHKGKYILVVEGSIPTGDMKNCCMIGGTTAYDSFLKAAKDALCIISMGACSTSGGIAAVEPNPTKAKGISEIMKDNDMTLDNYLSLPGCPPNPYNLVSVILYFQTFGKLPEMDAAHRPLFAYGRLIHEHCERRPHFNAGRFVKEYGDEGHKQGWCLYHMGCKGPETYANCSIIHFNEGAAWPIGSGCPCIGCTEGDILFKKPLFSLATVQEPTPHALAPTANPEGRGKPTTVVQAAVVGGLVGAAVGAGAVFAGKLPKEPEDEQK